MLLEEVILRDTRANQPAANLVAEGSLYYVTDESVTERSNGLVWEDYSDSAGGGGITQLTGDITAGPGSGSQVAIIGNASVSYAKIQDVSAAERILGRGTGGGAGDIQELTLSQILDFIGSAAQGDILYRGAASWARLAAGTSGQFLKTQGAGADPIWDTPAAGGGGAWELVQTQGGGAGATVDFVTNIGNYSELLLVQVLIGYTGSAVTAVQVSVDGGSSWLTVSGSYLSINAAGVESNETEMAMTRTLSGASKTSMLTIINSNGTTNPKMANNPGDNGSTGNLTFRIPTTSVINAIRFLILGSGNFNGGNFYIFGKA